MVPDTLKVTKCKIIFTGFFSLPDIFVDKNNYSQKDILNLVFQGQLRRLYNKQSNLSLSLENFEGPRKLPKKREENKFWRGMLEHGFWLPLFYKSFDNLRVEFASCDERDLNSLFEKVCAAEKSSSRFFIRIFPLGGFSIQMMTDFTMPSCSNGYLTVEDLESLVCDFFDYVTIDLYRGEEIVLKNQKVTELLENFGSMIRAKFLLDATGGEHIPMRKYALVDVKDFMGNWSVSDIKRLCGIHDPSMTLENLLINCKIGNPYREYQREDDLDFSGETCTLTCTKGMSKIGRKRWVDEIYDAVEFAYLRRLIMKDFNYFINQSSVQLGNKISDEKFLTAVRNKLYGEKLTWIDQRFLTIMQKLIESDDRIPNIHFRKNVVVKLLKMMRYKEILEILKKDLVETQKHIDKYNEQLSKRITALVSAIEKAVDLVLKLGVAA